MENKINDIVSFDNFIGVRWSSGEESFVNLKALRAACPCAFCSGEKDVFGAVYIGNKKYSDNSFSLVKYAFVGLYGVRFYWGDGHSDGIYTFDFLRDVCNEKK